MKKILGVVLLMLILSVPAYAAGPFVKLGRGVENIVLSPMEFLIQYMNATEDGGPVAGVINGIFRGAGMTVVRILGGAYEVITFPFPLPKNYEPLLDPESPWSSYRATSGG